MPEGERKEGQKFIEIARLPVHGLDNAPDSDDYGWSYAISLKDEKGSFIGGLVPEVSKTREDAEARAKKKWGEGLEIKFVDEEKSTE